MRNTIFTGGATLYEGEDELRHNTGRLASELKKLLLTSQLLSQARSHFLSLHRVHTHILSD